MNFSTLYQNCFYFCVVIIIATLSINFVSGLMVFSGAPIVMGVDVGDNSTNAFTMLTGLSGGMEYMWGLAVGTGLAITSFIAWSTHSTAPIAVWLFSTVFWTSYLRAISITGGFIPGDFLLIGTVGLSCMFVGAVIGIFGGSG